MTKICVHVSIVRQNVDSSNNLTVTKVGANDWYLYGNLNA